MTYPEPGKVDLDVFRVQGWTARTALRSRPFSIALLILLELVSTYSFLAGAFFLVAALSADIHGSLAGMAPQWLVEWLPESRPQLFLSAAVAFIFFTVSGAWRSLAFRRFSTRFESSLKLLIVRNENFWFGPRRDFAIKGGAERRLLEMMNKARAVVRSARAMINIVPNVIFLVSAIVVLINLSMLAIWWLASLGLASFFIQKIANRRVVALEEKFLDANTAFKRRSRDMLIANSRVESDEDSSHRDQLNAQHGSLSNIYFSRSMYIDFTRLNSFLALALLTAGFVIPYLAGLESFDTPGLLEQLLLLAILGRTIVMAISGTAANVAALAKYAFHANIVYLYFRRPRKTAALPKDVPARLLGPYPLNRHTISYYVDALVGHLGADVRAFPDFEVSFASREIQWRDGGMKQIQIVPLDEGLSSGRVVPVKSGDLLVCHRQVAKIERERMLDRAMLRNGFRRDAERTRKLASKAPLSGEADIDTMDEDLE